MAFQFEKLSIPEVVLITPSVFLDERGFFLESYKKSEFVQNGITCDFVQDNHSWSKKDVIRGFHYQIPPFAQAKLVRVIRGSIIDVAVDMRKDSLTFLQAVSVELTEDNKQMLFIPEGFAHGFVAFTPEVHLVYKCSKEYSKEHEAGVRFDDPTINFKWGITNPIVSSKDKELPEATNAIVF